MDDQSESDPREVEAGKYDLNYIGLDGNIACLGEDDSIQYKYPAICTVILKVGYFVLKKTCLTSAIRFSIGFAFPAL